MFTIELADQTIAVDNQYDYIKELCRDYILPGPAPEGAPVFRVSAEERAYENQDGGNWPEAYLECLAIYRKISENFLKKDILLFHCSALALDGKAYLFTAPSGTGKSTHARLWRQRFGDRVVTINDDKPLLLVKEEGVTVYGTPYAGKESLQTNTKAPVAGIVILHQAKENSIRQVSAQQAYPMLLNQTYRTNDPVGMVQTLELVGRLSQLPIFELGCTISQEAVELACQALTGRSE